MRGWKISGREKLLDFYKFEGNRSAPGGFTALFRKKKCEATLPWWQNFWGSLLRFSQTRAASLPVVLGDFGCDVPCQNTRSSKTNDETLKPFGEGAPSQIFPEEKGVCTLANRNPPITDHKLFPTRSIKMIDGSEKRKRELGFEHQSSRVFEKRSKSSVVFE